MKRPLLLLVFFLVVVSAFSQVPVILSQREQARVIDEILEDRLRTVLPKLMRQHGIDMWIVISREYNEDPVIKTLLPATWFAARRTTMLIMIDKGADKEMEFLAVSRYDVGKTFRRAWDPEHQPDQWEQLARIIENHDPKKIGINKSRHFGLADGISSTEYETLLNTVSKKYQITSAENLAIAWLETRSERELIMYPQICNIAHEIIREGFSDQVIHPGVTTTDDLSWWFRERIRELHLDTWFHPTVSIQRNESDVVFLKRPQPVVIMPGDLLHVDFGITYLRLNTDIQQHAYILRRDETDAPEYLKRALARGNKLQDIVVKNFALGRTGNEILALSRKQAIDQGLTPSIYTHPIGYHGHGAGTNIGMWDMQNGVPHLGEYKMNNHTAYSIELNVTLYLIEWKKEIQIKLEEDGYFDEKLGFKYLDGRQTELIVIPKPVKK